VLLGDGAGNFTTAGFVPAGDRPQGIDHGDIDRNGTIDLVVANSGSGNPISILYNDGRAAFQSTAFCCGYSSAWDVLVEDVDRNGWPDVVFVRSVTDDIRLLVYRQIAAGTWSGQGLHTGSQPRGVVAADFNGDGLVDLGVANRGSDTVSLYYAQSRPEGQIYAAVTTAAGDGSRALATADFNFDGKMDIVTANQYGDTVSYLENESPYPTVQEIVTYAVDASWMAGGWRLVFDRTAAGDWRAHLPNAGIAKIKTAHSDPADYFDVLVRADAGTPYRLWLRGKAQANYWGNDSVHIQFSDSVDESGQPIWRIGTTSSTVVNLEDCSGCRLRGWGWQDNGWGVGVLGPLVRFEKTGAHRIRIQNREDGLSIDQIVLSSGDYLSDAPGTLKDDTTILKRREF
jgi:hypothetical protein